MKTCNKSQQDTTGKPQALELQRIRYKRLLQEKSAQNKSNRIGKDEVAGSNPAISSMRLAEMQVFFC